MATNFNNYCIISGDNHYNYTIRSWCRPLLKSFKLRKNLFKTAVWNACYVLAVFVAFRWSWWFQCQWCQLLPVKYGDNAEDEDGEIRDADGHAVDPQPYTYGSDEDLWLFVRTRILAPLANSLCYSSCTIVCMRFLFTLLYIFRVLASLGGASTWLHDEPFFYETLSTSVERVL